jgi:signal peptide peptidase-like 2B
VQVVLRANASDGTIQTFYGLPGLFGAPLPRTPDTTLHLVAAQPETACGAAMTAVQRGPHTALLARRGNCSFADKAAHAQAAGAALLIVYDVQPGASSCRALVSEQERHTLAAEGYRYSYV